ncbi:MAG: redoxin family protein [Boseongicola sp.]|nr:MAG: redoxin family protein [Boseongicola sp.]
MTIAVGDRIPSAHVLQMGSNGPESIDVADHIAGKKVVIFALPGAYTSTCTNAHMPSFIRTFDAFREKGIDEIICVSVNDVFVSDHWGESTGAKTKGITMFADWNSAFGQAIGLTFDAPAVGYIQRIVRSAMVINDGVVEVLQIEESRGECIMTAGETLLEMV